MMNYPERKETYQIRSRLFKGSMKFSMKAVYIECETRIVARVSRMLKKHPSQLKVPMNLRE